MRKYFYSFIDLDKLKDRILTKRPADILQNILIIYCKSFRRVLPRSNKIYLYRIQLIKNYSLA